MIRLAILLALCACSGSPTATCTTVIRPKLFLLTWRDSTGKIVRVDSLYSRKEVLADTVQVCE